MKHHLLPLLCSFFLVISCKNSRVDLEDILTINFAKDVNVVPSDILDVAFIKLETNEKCFIDKSITQIESLHERLFILSGGSFNLFVFNLSGEFITSIGKKGSGPGEFIVPVSFSIDHYNNVISVVDIAQKKIINYDINNYEFISEKSMKYDCYCFEYLGRDTIVWKNIDYQSDYSKWHFILSDTNYTYLKGHVEKKFITGYSTGPTKNMYKINECVFAYAQYDPIVYFFSGERQQPVYNLKFGKYELPPIDYLNKISANNTNFIATLNQSNYLSYYCLFDTDRTLNVYYSVSGTPYIGIYDKKNNQVYNYSKEEFQDELKIGEIERPSGTINDYIVTSLHPHHLLHDEEKMKMHNQNLEYLIDQSEADDNPILVLFKLK